MDTVIAGAIASAIAAGAPMVIAGIGELLAERTGVMNIGIEGIMAMGAVSAILIVNGWVPNLWVGLLGAAVVGLLLGMLFAATSVTLKANQLLAGLALAFIGDGVSRHIGRPVAAVPAPGLFPALRLPLLGQIPVLGDGLFNHSVLVYVTYLVLPAVAYLILFRTRHGMAMRAVGQNPGAADASGVHVDRIRFLYTSLAGLMFGVAGAYLTLALTRTWTDGVVTGKGWIALTLVFFSRLHPAALVLGALLFGAATSVSFIVQVQGWGVNSFVLSMLPYFLTIALVLVSGLLRKRPHREEAGLFPAALTRPYHRE